MAFVRASGLSGFIQLAQSFGADGPAQLRSVGIDPSLLDDSRACVPYRAWSAALDATARAAGRPDFALELAQRQDLGILGALGVAVRHCADVRTAMACAQRYMFVHCPAIAFGLGVVPGTDLALFTFGFRTEGLGAAVQATELSVGLAARISHELGSAPRYCGVHFPHPRQAPLAAYARVFEAPVHFESPVCGLAFEPAQLTAPIEGASAPVHELALEHLARQADDSKASLTTRVRRHVQQALGTGESRCPDIAGSLAMHPRSLQRQLRAEGTTFASLRDAVRAELCRSYLAFADLPLTEVAALLDYGEQSVLTRSCKRWFGKTPKQLRRELVRA